MTFDNSEYGLRKLMHGSSSVESVIEDLQRRVVGKGHPEHPWLSGHYSPSSRIPCCDLTVFIRECLEKNMKEPIKWMMAKVLEANPGLWVTLGDGADAGRGWMDPLIDELADKDFSQYVRFADEREDISARALAIVLSKDGGGRRFWLIEDRPELLSWALSAGRPQWQPALDELRIKANTFIQEMRKDTPYWNDIPFFEPFDYLEPPPDSEALRRFRALPIGSRLQVCFAVRAGGGSLHKLSNYSIRTLGLDAEDSAKAILESELLIRADDEAFLLACTSKDQLLSLAGQVDAHVSNSWPKPRLLAAVRAKAPDAIRHLAETELLVTPSSLYAEELAGLIAFSESVKARFSLLGFA